MMPAAMSARTPSNPPLSHRILGTLYSRVPPLKYWGLRRGYLKRSGWVASGWARAPVDADGAPLPWYTYPCIDFLLPRLTKEMRVFEYGSGQSTRWWAARVLSVDAVEDDPAWMARVSQEVPANVDLRFAVVGGGQYAESILGRDPVFDIVVIDGSDRDHCARVCLEALKPNGVIVFDNTQKPGVFEDGLDFLSARGFKRIDFFGLGPLNMDGWCTSVLYRPDNCLGI